MESSDSPKGQKPKKMPSLGANLSDAEDDSEEEDATESDDEKGTF